MKAFVTRKTDYLPITMGKANDTTPEKHAPTVGSLDTQSKFVTRNTGIPQVLNSTMAEPWLTM